MKTGILSQSSIHQDITNHECSPSPASLDYNVGQFGQDMVEIGPILAGTSANVSANTMEFDFDLDKNVGNDMDMDTSNYTSNHTPNSKGDHTLNPHGHNPNSHIHTPNLHVIPPPHDEFVQEPELSPEKSSVGLIPKEKDPIDKENFDPGEKPYLCILVCSI